MFQKQSKIEELMLRPVFGPILTAIIRSICLAKETALQGAMEKK